MVKRGRARAADRGREKRRILEDVVAKKRKDEEKSKEDQKRKDREVKRGRRAREELEVQRNRKGVRGIEKKNYRPKVKSRRGNEKQERYQIE